MALTTQDKVTGMENMNCDGDHHSSSNKPHYQCDHKIQKWTYAIPMEIIYLTPLNRWNPYDIEHKEGDRAKFVTAGGRNGKLSKPYNGTSEKKYFITPSEFFDGDEFLPGMYIYLILFFCVSSNFKLQGLLILTCLIEFV